jgi:predicted DNA binding CopG/RHH family protein
MKNLNDSFDQALADNSSNNDDSKSDNRPGQESKKKLKNVKVKDAISKGRTMTGSPADKIEINPVIEAAEKTAVIGMARMNPPTTGHHKFIKKIESEAEKAGGSAHIILSHSTGSTKNPLDPEKKKEYVKKLVKPSTHVEMTSSEAPSMLHQATRLHQHAHHLVVVGSAGKGDQDRANQFHQLLTKYNGVHGPHGYYNFKSIKKVSSGDRDPDAGGVGGISGTKMREHANNGDVKSFKQGLPKELHDHAEEMMKSIQKVKDVEPIKKKKLKEELLDAFEQEMDISASGLKALKEKAFKSGINFDSIFEQYTIGYIDNLLTSNGKMTNEQAGFASVNSFIANSLFESGIPMNTASYGMIRGMGYVTGDPDGDGSSYVTTNMGDADTQDNILKLMKSAHDALHASVGSSTPHPNGKDAEPAKPNPKDVTISGTVNRQVKTEAFDNMFEAEVEKFGKNREVIPRSKQPRNYIDLTTRNGEDRKVDDRPYRQQAITKQVFEDNKNSDKHEYDYEGEMAMTQLRTVLACADELCKMMKPDTNLPEWVQAKITMATDYISTCRDYMKSEMNEEHKRGLWDNIHAKQERIKNGSGEHMRKPGSKGAPTKADLVRSQNEDVNSMFEDFYGAVVPSPLIHDRQTTVKKNSLDEAFVTETEAWQKKAGKNPEGGLNRKGIQSYRNAHPGSHLSLAVTKKPSELKAGSKSANRRKSFCARMGGMKKRLTSAKTARDPDSRINKALRKWHCHEDTINELSVPLGDTGKRTNVKTPLVPIRMASGKIKRLPPGKSGSSGGGGDGGE